MKSMSIAHQFTVLVAAFAVATPASVVGLSYVFSSNLSATRRLAADGARQSDRLFGIIASMGKFQSNAQRMLRQKDPDEIEKLLEENKSAVKSIRQKFQEMGAAAGEVSRAFEELERANQRCEELLMHGEQAQGQELFITESNPAFERLLQAIGAMQSAESRQEEAAVAELDGRSGRAQALVYILVGVAIAGLVILAILLVRHVNHQLREVVQELTQTSNGAASSAAQISRGSQTLAQGASQQAASIEETSASSEQISAMTRRNAEHSREAAQRMKQATKAVEEANQRLTQMVRSMDEIQTSSDQVGKIIRTIDEIAFQTNILALNAAVEAARAGESGMGFAVVADEVRNLAHRSAEAARNTAVLIEESVTRSKDGKGKLDEMASAILSITKSSNEVSTLVEEIQRGSEEQARGIEQVNRALIEMQTATQNAAASAEESAAAGQELSSQSENLRATVHTLAGMVGGQ
jgi:methyl-accepting chemotaxis protein